MSFHFSLKVRFNRAYSSLGVLLVLTHNFFFPFSFGLGHDGSENQCEGGTYIMAAVLPNGVNAMRWSTCSADEMQTFLR